MRPPHDRPSLRACAKALARLSLLLLLAATGVSPAGAQQATAPAPIRALYITGGGYHDFDALQKIVPPGISARTRIEWTVDDSAGEATDVLIPRHANTDWADEFDVVVYNMSFSYVVDPIWIERLAFAHRDRGVPAVVLHGATHSFRRSTSDAWGQLMGAFSMRHDSQREFTIERVAPEHPIIKPLPKGWGPGRDELYEILKTWPSMTTLLQGWSVETEQHQPVAWTNEFGGARIFVTTMGHNVPTMEDPVFLDLVTRGLLWTVGRLQEDGTPAPGYGPSEG